MTDPKPAKRRTPKTTESTDVDKKRGRKTKYESNEEKIAARRKQKREYRLRKKEELAKLKQLVRESNEKTEEEKVSE